MKVDTVVKRGGIPVVREKNRLDASTGNDRVFSLLVLLLFLLPRLN